MLEIEPRPPIISRRAFLKVIATALVIASQLPSPSLAHHAQADEAWWGSYDWWPLKDGIVNDAGVLMHTLHESEGPLDLHDAETGRRARKWAEDLARRALSQYPQTASWAGYCHAKANAIILEEPPIDWIGEGLLIAKHAGDIQRSIKRDRIIPRIQGGNRIVIEVPRHWSSVAYVVREGRIVRTDFGFSHKRNSLGEIIVAYVPYHDDGTLEVDERLRRMTAWFINPELDEEYVNWRAFNT